MDIAGKYIGYYEYGAGYELPYFGERVKIEVTISGNRKGFTGTITEEASDISVPFEATIKGDCEGNYIDFIKTYPVKPIISDSKSNDLVIEDGQLEIIHNGFIDVKFNAIYGQWTIVDQFINDEGVEQDFYSSGIWYLTPIK